VVDGNSSAAGPPDAPDGTEGAVRSALLIDWGGVLTTNLFASFHAHCVSAGIDPQLLAERFRTDPEARELLIALEKGQLAEQDFERQFARLLEVGPEGLIDGLFAGVQPDEAMVAAVRAARAAGVRTALVSNSWGVHRYPRDLFDDLFDGIVISGEEGIRKPSRRMYELGAERAGVLAAQCVYVDDLPFNLTPAEELGMATVHHTAAETTIPELERLLGVALAG
jgi:putative hydrolase of the HAD superfamily